MIGTRVFISTGGSKGITAVREAERLQSALPYGIELSGGIYDADLVFNLERLRRHTPIMLHNYFPPPRQPFVLNLASSDAQLRRKCREFVQSALLLSASVGSKFFGVHAGWLNEPQVSHLGEGYGGPVTRPRAEALDILEFELAWLGGFARDLGVQLLVENHALSVGNFTRVGSNFLLLAEDKEIFEFIPRVWPDVGLLLDVGHLKVSSCALGFDLSDAMLNLRSFCRGYHLSDNSGSRDEHRGFASGAWFFPLLNREAEFFTVEVHGESTQEVLASAQAVDAWATRESTGAGSLE